MRVRPGRLLLALLLVVTLGGTPVRARLAARHSAAVRDGVVLVDGAVRWRGRTITSGLAWSERRDALAFAGWDQRGRAQLVVLIVDDDLEPATISWPVPLAAQPARAVTWLGLGRVGAGPSELRPKMFAELRLGR